LIRAYETWGSPDALNREKARLAKARQEDYEGLKRIFNLILSDGDLFIFSII